MGLCGSPGVRLSEENQDKDTSSFLSKPDPLDNERLRKEDAKVASKILTRG